MNISVSEIQNFLRCRRMWDFTSPNRQMLVRRGVPDTALHIGSLVHEAFDLQVKHPDTWMTLWIKYIDDLEQEIRTDYRDMVGASLGPEELELMQESRDTATGVVSNYFNRYSQEAPLGSFEYVHTEVSFRIKIPGTRNHLVGTLDGIAKEENGNIWVVEHKTYAQRLSYESLMTNIQTIAYMWASTMLFGPRVQGVLYDGVSKKVLVIPKILNNGSVAKAQNISTTPAIYTESVLLPKQDPSDYTEFIAELQDRIYGDKSPFWTRHLLGIPRSAMVGFEGDVQNISRDMARKKITLYPNMPFLGCWDCRVRNLCDAMQFDEDVDGLKEALYTTGKPYRTIKAQQMEALTAGVLGV